MSIRQRFTIAFWLGVSFAAVSACSEHAEPDRDGGAASFSDDGTRGEAGTSANGMDGGNPPASDGGAASAEGGAQPSEGSASSTEGGAPKVDGGTSSSEGGTSSSKGGTAESGAQEAGADAEPGPCDPSTAPEVGSLSVQTAVDGLDGLTFATQPPGSSDWYLLQQGGLIRVFAQGALRPTPFLDVSAQVMITADPVTSPFDDERGLLGLAFAPDYATSGKFYIMMTPTTGAGANRDTVLEYTRAASDPYVADPASAKTLVQLPASAPNHNGGNVVFGPDGMLYVGTGDGGGMCNSDQPGAPQDPNMLFGKILRLDPKGSAPNYAAAGNPFASAGGDPRVWQYGLRNPYRFSFDKATGDLYIGDVGQDSYEEVDFAPNGVSGLNFGWPAFEGNVAGTCGGNALRPGAQATPPIVHIDRRAFAGGDFGDYTSVIGGYVYRGSALPQLRGMYLFGDYEGGRMAAIRQCGTQTSPHTAILKNRNANTPNAPSFARGQPAFDLLTAIVQGNDSELYFVADIARLLKVVPGT